MKRLITLLLLAVPSFAQHSVYAGKPVQNASGRGVPASILVCTATATGFPCSPLATIYTVPTPPSSPGSGTVIAGSMITTDANGNFTFGCDPGLIQLQITVPGTTYTFVDNCPSLGGGTGVPGGSPGQAQFNNAGAFGGIANVIGGSWLASAGTSTTPSFQTKTFTDARDYTGATSDVQITNAVAALPGNTGTVWAFYTTNQSWAACPSFGANPIHLVLSPVTFTVAVNCTIPANVTLEFLRGAMLSITTSTTTTILGVVIAGRQQIFTNILASQGTISFLNSTRTTTLYPQWFGAKVDGSTDDLPVLQAVANVSAEATNSSSNASTIDLGCGTYKLVGQLQIGVSNGQHHVNLVGVSPLCTTINSTVSAGNQAIYLTQWDYSTASGFYLHQAGSAGVGNGITLGGTNGGSGTQNFGSILRNIKIDSFDVCLSSTDNNNVTSSEIEFDSVAFQNCNQGFRNSNFNGLDYVFKELQMSNNVIGLNMVTAGVTVLGGSASNDGTDFFFSNGGINVVIGFRSEVVTNQCVSQQNAHTSIINMLCDGLASHATHTAITQASGFLTIENSKIDGQIVETAGGFLSIRNTEVYDPNNTYSFTSHPNNQGPGFDITGASSNSFCIVSTSVCGHFEVENSFNNGVLIPSGFGWVSTDGTNAIATIMNSGQGPALTVSSNAIAVNFYTHHVGAGLIKNINLPTSGSFPNQVNSWHMNCIQLIADAAYTTDTTGNIAIALTATINGVITWCYDQVATKWYPESASGAFTALTVTDPGVFGSSQTNTSAACETSFGATTLSVGGTTTDTGLNCLPATAVIDAVVYRITTTITTAANFTIGDATTAARFCATQSTITSGTTGTCFVQADQTGAPGPRQVSAAKVRVTTNVNPGAGAIRLIVYYHTWTPPTS